MMMTGPGVTLDQLFDQIEKAMHGDRQLRLQLLRTMQKLARHPQAAPEDRELGKILGRVLLGERSLDLGALPGELAAELAELLARLE